MNEKKQYHLVKVIQKIEVFRGFDAQEVQRLLRVCHFTSFPGGTRIYRLGEASDEMLVLLRGKLLVVGESGDELAHILPGMPTGEMGLFTGQPRSANIDAVTDSTAIVLRRAEITLALANDKDMQIKVLQNLIRVLSARLTDANRLVESQARTLHDLLKRLEQYEPPGPAAESEGEEMAEGAGGAQG